MNIQGFISKNRSSHQILDAIEQIMAGNTVADADVDEDPISTLPLGLEPQGPILPISGSCLCDGLMSAQRQILKSIADGMPDTKICDLLNIKMDNLEYRIKGLSMHLGANNRAQLIRLCKERLHYCQNHCPAYKNKPS
jgi:DNA-binding NarL/FixJ family response regulator